MYKMTDGITFILPKLLEDIIIIAKILMYEEKKLGNPFIPKLVMDWQFEQGVAKFWIDLVKNQRRLKLTSAYDLPLYDLAQRFMEHLMDHRVTYSKENYLAHVNIPENVLVKANIHGPQINSNKKDIVVRQVKSDAAAESTHRLSMDKTPDKTKSCVFQRLSTQAEPEIVVVKEHKAVHKSVQRLVSAQAKQKSKSKKFWSIRGLMKAVCPCVRSNKVKRTEE